MEKTKTTAHGPKVYKYWMATWRVNGRTHNEHLGSCDIGGMTESEAREKAYRIKISSTAKDAKEPVDVERIRTVREAHLAAVIEEWHNAGDARREYYKEIVCNRCGSDFLVIPGEGNHCPMCTSTDLRFAQRDERFFIRATQGLLADSEHDKKASRKQQVEKVASRKEGAEAGQVETETIINVKSDKRLPTAALVKSGMTPGLAATFLRQRQSLPIAQKIILSRKRIRDWCEHWGYEVFVSFSGGIDSAVTVDLVRTVYPRVPIVFVDTGVEYPEIRRFAKSQDNVIVLKPKMHFHEVIEKYGYPSYRNAYQGLLMTSEEIQIAIQTSGTSDSLGTPVLEIIARI